MAPTATKPLWQHQCDRPLRSALILPELLDLPAHLAEEGDCLSFGSADSGKAGSASALLAVPQQGQGGMETDQMLVTTGHYYALNPDGTTRRRGQNVNCQRTLDDQQGAQDEGVALKVRAV